MWEHMVTVTAASRVSVVVPSPPNLAALLHDYKISAFVPPYHVDGGTNA